jgi:putative transposase
MYGGDIMARCARLLLDNVCYHVITRGNQKQVVFKDARDYAVYLKLLSKYKHLYGIKLYGWCLMDNHVHMVMEPGALSRAMHGLNLSYAQYFKYRHSAAGHFWQDRFKSFVIQKDEYLINCISYIEYNPVRAEIALRPEDYRWSSYRARILGEKNPLLDDLVL